MNRNPLLKRLYEHFGLGFSREPQPIPDSETTDPQTNATGWETALLASRVS